MGETMVRRDRIRGLVIFYAIRCDALANVPEGVRKFVEDYFDPKDILGIPCLVSAETEDDQPWNMINWSDYDADLDDESPLDWLEAHPQVAFRFHSEEDMRTMSSS